MRTAEEIKTQIDGLKLIKNRLPEYSLFGDANHKGIDAQLDILERVKDMDDFEEYDEDEYDSEQEFDYIQSQAQEADDWLHSDSAENLFDDEDVI